MNRFDRVAEMLAIGFATLFYTVASWAHPDLLPLCVAGGGFVAWYVLEGR